MRFFPQYAYISSLSLHFYHTTIHLHILSYFWYTNLPIQDILFITQILTMAKVLKLGTTISLTTFKKIGKLRDPEGCLKQKRIMRNHLQIFGLQIYIVPKHEQLRQDNADLEKWVKAYDLTYTALRICVEGNVYSDIRNITNIKTAWTILETNFKPQGSGYLNNKFQNLDSLTFSSYKNPNYYVSKFWMIVNKLQSFSTKMKLDENWLIYQFHINLGNEHS